MSDALVHVPFGDDRAETATLLLDAAESSKDHEQSVVVVDHFTDSFVVPESVAKSAGLDTFDPDADFAEEVEAARKAAESTPPAKKTAAKKTAAKKS